MLPIRLLCQCLDNVTKGRQGLIDFLGLIESLSSCTSDTDTFATRQIHKVELADANSLRWVSLAAASLPPLFSL